MTRGNRASFEVLKRYGGAEPRIQGSTRIPARTPVLTRAVSFATNGTLGICHEGDDSVEKAWKSVGGEPSGSLSPAHDARSTAGPRDHSTSPTPQSARPHTTSSSATLAHAHLDSRTWSERPPRSIRTSSPTAMTQRRSASTTRSSWSPWARRTTRTSSPSSPHSTPSCPLGA